MEVQFEQTGAFKALFDHATQGILVCDKQGVILVVNPAGACMFGYAQDELTGNRIEVLLPESMRQMHTLHRTQYVQKPHSRPMGQDLELYGRRKDESTFPIEISLSPYTTETETYTIAFFVDITLRKKLAQQREEIALQLENERHAGELKSRFVSIASHEFRTPLSAILSSASLVQTYAQRSDYENVKKHAIRIKNSVGHLNNILTEFLSFGRIEDNKLNPRLEVVAVCSFLNEIEEELLTVLKPGQKIQYSHSEEVELFTDKHLLHTILINLLTNASKYSPENTAIEVSCKHVKSRIEVTVKDSGIGIPKADQAQIFQRFFRAGNAGIERGTGLGLYIVKRYTELIGGTVRFTSQVDEGSSFTVSFPEKEQ